MGETFSFVARNAISAVAPIANALYSARMLSNDAPQSLRLIVAAALVRPDGAILLQKRPAGKAMAGLWEFPGGKIEPGETPEAALVRELEEELGIVISGAALEPISFATEAQGDAHMLLLLYLVRQWQGEPQPHAAEALDWVRIDMMSHLPMPPADLPLVTALKRQL